MGRIGLEIPPKRRGKVPRCRKIQYVFAEQHFKERSKFSPSLLILDTAHLTARQNGHS